MVWCVREHIGTLPLTCMRKCNITAQRGGKRNLTHFWRATTRQPHTRYTCYTCFICKWQNVQQRVNLLKNIFRIQIDHAAQFVFKSQAKPINFSISQVQQSTSLCDIPTQRYQANTNHTWTCRYVSVLYTNNYVTISFCTLKC